VGLSVGYFAHVCGLLATDNQAVTPATFDSYCITAPVDSRLPGGGGNQILRLYDVRRRSLVVLDNLVTQVSELWKPDPGVQRLPMPHSRAHSDGAAVLRGPEHSRTVTDNCYQNSDPDGDGSVFTGASTGDGSRTDAF